MQGLQGQARLLDATLCSSQRSAAVMGRAIDYNRGHRTWPLDVRALVPVLASLARFLTSFFYGRTRTQDAVTLESEGLKWCDSTERELIRKAATWPHRW